MSFTISPRFPIYYLSIAAMRHVCSSFCRLIICLLITTFLTSGIAMAAYVCPQSAASMTADMMEEMPCAEMDQEKPVHCAKHQAGEDLALEHFPTAPTLTPPSIAFAIPVIKPVVPDFLSSVWLDVPTATGTSPPYLHTQRLRI